MIWRDVCIVIPAILSAPGRADSLRDLLVLISQQCPGAIVRVIPQWRETVRHEQVLTDLAGGLCDVPRERILWLEDDVFLCQGFGALSLAAIDEHVDERNILSLFSSVRYAPGVRELTSLVGSQAVAMTNRVARDWAQMLLNLRDNPKPRRPYAIDLELTDLCRGSGIAIWAVFPSLVQHGHLPSAWGHTAGMHSPTFTG